MFRRVALMTTHKMGNHNLFSFITNIGLHNNDVFLEIQHLGKQVDIPTSVTVRSPNNDHHMVHGDTEQSIAVIKLDHFFYIILRYTFIFNINIYMFFFQIAKISGVHHII